MSATEGRVVVRREGPVAIITLDRPAKLNALSTHIETSLLDAVRSPDVTTSSAVVITGGDAVFSAGADVDELAVMTTDSIAAYYRASGRVYEVIADLPQPTISAIAGYCFGGGFELALATDFRVADSSAVFCLPEVAIGIVPSSGGTYRLTKAVGPARARDLILRGRRMGPDEALTWGLLTSVTPPGAHLQAALGLATEIAAQPAAAVAMAKQLINRCAETDRETALLLEQLAYSALNGG
ncbi:MAG TPA: enoyl-CoA hydratase/isomerase family protein [Nocardioidaceae bacterium]|nr:enoyl-CoA hydratase/isomerase family protein [Nocardioidaceae bacterium]